MEEELTGGNSTRVTRIGDTVHREAGPWSPAIHRLLGVIRESGITEVPKALGFDEQGREVLSFLPGDVPGHPMPEWVWNDQVLIEVNSPRTCSSVAFPRSAGLPLGRPRHEVVTNSC